VSGRVASPLLRTVLSDPSEDLRLLAYGMLDTLEKRINRAIDIELQALGTAQADDGEGAPGPEALAAHHRLSDLYWELVYQHLVQGDLRDHAIKESLRYCDMVLQHAPGHPQLTLRRGRLLYEQGDTEAAAEAYERAGRLGMPATRLLPYQAELAFQRRDFAGVEELVRELNQWDALPRLRPVIDYWSGSR
jgi:tetratricopeptide (TPR) repeat protein